MTKEEALKVLDTIPTIGEQVDALEMAIKALEQQPCDDAISRQAVPSIIECHKNIDSNDAIVWIEKEIGELPSVTPQPRTGRWINIWDKNDYGISTQARCNRCKQISDRPLGIFCKWCGARMEVEE